MKRTDPTRHLCSPKPHRYVPAMSTDIRKTFERARRLMAMREAWARSEANPNNYPKESS